MLYLKRTKANETSSCEHSGQKIKNVNRDGIGDEMRRKTPGESVSISRVKYAIPICEKWATSEPLHLS